MNITKMQSKWVEQYYYYHNVYISIYNIMIYFTIPTKEFRRPSSFAWQQWFKRRKYKRILNIAFISSRGAIGIKCIFFNFRRNEMIWLSPIQWNKKDEFSRSFEKSEILNLKASLKFNFGIAYCSDVLIFP